MDLKISDEQMKSVIAGAVLTAISPEQREALVMGALVKLLEPQEPLDRYTSKKRPSRVEEAFLDAVSVVAREEVKRLLSDDDGVRAKVAAVVREATDKAFTGDARDKLVDRLTSAIALGLDRDERDER